MRRRRRIYGRRRYGRRSFRRGRRRAVVHGEKVIVVNK